MNYNHPGSPGTFDGAADNQLSRAAVRVINRVVSFYAARLTRRSLTPLARASASKTMQVREGLRCHPASGYQAETGDQRGQEE